MTKNNTGVLGIDYEEVTKVVNDSDMVWMCFMKDNSDGLTKTGQILLQLAIESYVYAVLGSQAQMRWAIVNQGAKYLETQQIFHRLVKDVIAQDDPVKSISNMGTAIKNTNVLNVAITPIILIPSNMIILEKKVEGYNNVLTLATNTRKFGVNTNVNYVKPVERTPITPVTKSTIESKGSGRRPLPSVSSQINNDTLTMKVFPKIDKTTYLLGSMVTLRFLVA